MESRHEGAQRLAAMAVPVFLIGGHLGHGARFSARHEGWIVPKAAGAPPAIEDLAVPGTLPDQRTRIVEALHEHHDAAIPCSATLGGQASQRVQQLQEIVLVTRALTRITR